MTTVSTQIKNDLISCAYSRGVRSVGSGVLISRKRKGIIKGVEVITSWGNSQLETQVYYLVEVTQGPYEHKALERYPEAEIEDVPPF